jgi:hypothetical protein
MSFPNTTQIDLEKPSDQSLSTLEPSEPEFQVSDFIEKALPQFPLDVFGPALKEHIQRVAERMMVLPEVPAVELIMNSSIALGGLVNLKANDSWVHSGCLFVATVGPSGAGKTAVRNAMGFNAITRQKTVNHENHTELQNPSEAAEASAVEASTLDSIYETKSTVETLFAMHSVNPSGIARCSSELRTIVNGLNQYTGGAGNDDSILIEAWDGNMISNPVDKGRELRCIQRPYIPISGGIQPKLLPDLVNGKFCSSGLTQRFLFNSMAPQPRSENATDIDLDDNPALAIVQELLVLRKSALRGYQDTQEVQLIELTNAAKEVLKANENDLIDRAHALYKQDNDSFMYSYLKRLVDQQYRITLLIHIIDCLSSGGNPLTESVTQPTAKAALRVVNYFEHTAGAMFNEVYQDSEKKKLTKIVSFINDEIIKGVKWVQRRDIQQKVKNKIKGEELERLLCKLVQQEILVEQSQGKSTSYSIKSCPNIPVVC